MSLWGGDHSGSLKDVPHAPITSEALTLSCSLLLFCWNFLTHGPNGGGDGIVAGAGGTVTILKKAAL